MKNNYLTKQQKNLVRRVALFYALLPVSLMLDLIDQYLDSLISCIHSVAVCCFDWGTWGESWDHVDLSSWDPSGVLRAHSATCFFCASFFVIALTPSSLVSSEFISSFLAVHFPSHLPFLLLLFPTLHSFQFKTDLQVFTDDSSLSDSLFSSLANIVGSTWFVLKCSKISCFLFPVIIKLL